MITHHEYLGYQIRVECGQHRLLPIQSAWAASFAYTHNGVLIQDSVQACACQKTAQAASDKALRFAMFSIDARADRTRDRPVALRLGEREGLARKE